MKMCSTIMQLGCIASIYKGEMITLQPNNGKKCLTIITQKCYTVFCDINVCVAQLDRAVDYGSTGQGFESFHTRFKGRKIKKGLEARYGDCGHSSFRLLF